MCVLWWCEYVSVCDGGDVCVGLCVCVCGVVVVCVYVCVDMCVVMESV